MTKLDENDIVEVAIVAAIIDALGPLATLIGALFYLGLGIILSAVALGGLGLTISQLF
mgnify:CR=1 FL=1